MHSTKLLREKVIYLIVIVVVLSVIWFVFNHAKKVEAPIEPTAKITYTNSTPDIITVELPFPGAVTGKDFSIIGKARGNWFFEASFPIEVLDKDGKSLYKGIAQAQGEWMTTDLVAFKASVNIPQSYIGPATLILKKDNPSGIAEKDASISFPITIEY